MAEAKFAAKGRSCNNTPGERPEGDGLLIFIAPRPSLAASFWGARLILIGGKAALFRLFFQFKVFPDAAREALRQNLLPQETAGP